MFMLCPVRNGSPDTRIPPSFWSIPSHDYPLLPYPILLYDVVPHSLYHLLFAGMQVQYLPEMGLLDFTGRYLSETVTRSHNGLGNLALSIISIPESGRVALLQLYVGF